MRAENRKETEQEKIERGLYVTGLCLLGMAGVIFLIWQMTPDFFRFLWTPCVFHTLTGLYCPGCGGTRAVGAFFKGKFLLSFGYHPIVLYGMVIYGWFLISHTIQNISRGKCRLGMRYRDIYLWIALGIVIINTAVKDIALTAYHTDILSLLDAAMKIR